MGHDAVEYTWCKFFESKKRFILSHSSMISATYEEALKVAKTGKSAFPEFSENHPSSIPAEIKGNWGRIVIFLFLNYMDVGLSNTLFYII